MNCEPQNNSLGTNWKYYKPLYKANFLFARSDSKLKSKKKILARRKPGVSQGTSKSSFLDLNRGGIALADDWSA